MNKIILGSHVALTSPDYLLGSVKEAISYGANTFMFYTGAPQNTIRKDTQLFKKEEAFLLMKKNNIDPENVIVHVPYIINLCSAKIDTRVFAIDFLTKEILRVHDLGFKYLVLHPGSRLDQELEVGLRQVIDGLNEAFENTKHTNVVILLETMAGKGSEVGTNIYEIKTILLGVKNNERIGVCLDTCHLSDSGIDINNFNQYLDDFEKDIGLDKIKCIHINDSMNPIGARKDRHQNIGYGHIGFEALLSVIYHEKLLNIPKILETPYVELNGKYQAPYKIEIEMIKAKAFNDWKK